MTKKTLLFLTTAMAFARAVSGATLGVVPDKTTYTIGETVTLSINGDAEGVSAFGIFGRLDFNGSLVDNGTRSQKTIGQFWTKGILDATDTNVDSPTSANAWAFNQVNIGGGFQTATSPISTVTLIAQSVGIVNVIWETSTPGYQLTYFGLSSAPGTSFTIVPEPSTSILVALGLVSLVVGSARGRAHGA